MNILWFSETINQDKEICGNKGAYLGELFNSNIPVPQGFILTKDAHEKFFQENKIDKQINNILENVNLNDDKLLKLKTDEINDIILKAEFPKDLKDEILEDYENLNVDNEVLKYNNKNALSLIKVGRSLPYVAIRSSPLNNKESLTYLSVKGNNALLLSIKKCFASLFNFNSVYQRIKENTSYEYLPIIVQRMINAESSGIITVNENNILINALYGVYEINNNLNKYIVDKDNLKILNKIINKQEYMLIREETLNKNIKRKIPETYSEKVLNDEQILKLSEYAKKIEEIYKKQINVEFAIESGKVYVLHAKDLNIN